MSKLLIGSVVGGLILLIWQSASWMAFNLHQDEYLYTENQDSILAYLAENLEGEGSYFLPTVSPDATQEDMDAYFENATGKPWATVQYHDAMEMNMVSNMIRAFVVNTLAVFLLCWVLIHFREVSMKPVLLSTLAVGVLSYMTTSYLQSIWMEANSFAYLIDTLAQWGLCGLWLGFWLPRGTN